VWIINIKGKNMKRVFKIVMFLLLINVALFGGEVLGELTNKLDKCKSFPTNLDSSLFNGLKSDIASEKAQARDNYVFPKNPSSEQTIRLYTSFSNVENAYIELKALANEYNTALTDYENIKNEKSWEQAVKMQISNEKENNGFNCYIKKDKGLWIASYPYGKDDRESKKLIAIIQNDGKMYFYKKVTKGN
jgi:hypothetical protein